MSTIDKLDVAQIEALASKLGIDRAKVIAAAQSMLPTLKSKWDGLTGGGEVPLFKDLMASDQFQKMAASGEFDGAAADAAAASGLDADTVKKMLPELSSMLVGR